MCILRVVYLSVHFGTAAAVPDDLVPDVQVLHGRRLTQRVLNGFDHLRLVKLEGSQALVVQGSVLLRDRLMSFDEPSARRYERCGGGGFTAVVERFARGAAQDGHVEAVRAGALEPTAFLLRRLGGPTRLWLVLGARSATCVNLRRR